MSAPTPKSFSIGVLLFPLYQWLDAAGPVDYLNNHTRQMLEFAQAPAELIAKAFTIEWHYLSSTGTLDPVKATSGPTQNPSTTFKDCPHLDYLLVPGPDPSMELLKECIDFIKGRLPELQGLLTVCTGSMVIAQTGVLDGLNVATNKNALKRAVEFGLVNKKVKWVLDRRFTVDGKVWSTGGITSGIDLAAEFARVYADPAVARFAQEGAEYRPNPAYPDPFAYLAEGIEVGI